MARSGDACEILITEGTAADVIIREARNDYTLIILGRHGNGRRTEALIGSTAEKVCRDAQRPVLLVPAVS